LSHFSEWLQQILPAHADRHATVGSKELLARQEAANGNQVTNRLYNQKQGNLPHA